MHGFLKGSVEKFEIRSLGILGAFVVIGKSS